jgi:nitroreductase
MSDLLYDSLKIIAERRKSIREFSDKDVSDDDIQKILDIAKTSPYASSRKNWGIEVIRDGECIHKAAEAVDAKCKSLRSELREDFSDMFASYSKSFSIFNDAPVVLVPYFRISPTVSSMLKSKDDSVLTWERDTFIKSISCVTMMMLLAAESLHLGACCITGALIAEEELLDIFNIKNGRHIGALVPLGHISED